MVDHTDHLASASKKVVLGVEHHKKLMSSASNPKEEDFSQPEGGQSYHRAGSENGINSLTKKNILTRNSSQ